MSKSRYRPEHMRMLNDKRWAETKAIVDARAKGRCEWCIRDGKANGIKRGYIREGKDHHHLIPFESARTTAEAERLCYDPNNVVLLCVEHHRACHNQKGYHKKENVKARREQAFERWKERQQRGQSDACVSSAEREAPRCDNIKERQSKRNNDGTEQQ